MENYNLIRHFGFTKRIVKYTGRAGHRVCFQERCRVCDHKLKRTDSIRAGTGPICRHKLIY